MWALWRESYLAWVPQRSVRWALFCEVTPAWLEHVTLATWALCWQLEPAGCLLPSVMRGLWLQDLTAGLPTFSEVRPVLRVHSCQVSIPMGMWAFCSEVPTAGLLTVS